MKRSVSRPSGLLRRSLGLAACVVGIATGQPQAQGRGQQTTAPASSGSGRGQAPPGRGGQPTAEGADVHALHVQGGVYVLVGGGGNVTVQVGDDGVLLVDTSFAQMSDKVMTEIRKLSTKPIKYIINTHAHPDHVGGNGNLAKINPEYLAPPAVAIIAHENVLNRMSAPTGAQAAFPATDWPTDTYFTKEKDIFFNGEAIILTHQPAAHTDGDSIVFFRRSDVVSTGDIFVTATFPFIDTERGGSVTGIINGLNNILDITVPREKQEGGTYVIPGHGRIGDEHDVLEYRDMLTIIRDRIQDAVKRGMTLQQVQAMKPTLDYDARWGSTGGVQTSEMFVEKIYREMSTKK
jgi:cyclase